MEKNVGVANVPGIFPRLREKEILRYVYKKQDQNTRRVSLKSSLIFNDKDKGIIREKF